MSVEKHKLRGFFGHSANQEQVDATPAQGFTVRSLLRAMPAHL